MQCSMKLLELVTNSLLLPAIYLCDCAAHNRACRHPSRAVGVIHEDDDIPFSSPKGSLSLLCTWGVCRGKIEGLDRSREPYVKVHFKVGIRLSFGYSASSGAGLTQQALRVRLWVSTPARSCLSGALFQTLQEGACLPSDHHKVFEVSFLCQEVLASLIANEVISQHIRVPRYKVLRLLSCRCMAV